MLLVSVIITNYIIISSDSHSKHSFALLGLDIIAGIASSFGIIAIYRHKLKGHHGRSYLFLTLGLISWFCADISLTYYYYGLGIKEQPLASIADAFWFAGYGFFAVHLFITLKFLPNRINTKSILVIASVASASFLIYTVIRNLTSFEFHNPRDTIAFSVNITYPILDSILIVPATVILVKLREDYQQSIPWLLSSLSLLINAIADDGFVNDVASGNSHNLWFWDLFFITDYLIMAAALYWYNRFHISSKLNKSNKIEL